MKIYLIGFVAALIAALIATIWYVAHCAWWPYGACRRCDGAGKFRSPSGRSWRRCRRCKGSGERVRVGRRVYDAIKRRRDAGRD